jgi:predicted metal-binding membrane protein
MINKRYDLRGDFVECCDCYTICPCWVSDLPDEDHCSGVYVWRFDKDSRIDGIDVSGMKVAAAAFHAVRSGGQAMFFIDTREADGPETAARAYRAILNAFTGKIDLDDPAAGEGQFQSLSRLLGTIVGDSAAEICTEFKKNDFEVSIKVGKSTIATAKGGDLVFDAVPMNIGQAALTAELGIEGEVQVQRMGELTVHVAALPGGPLELRALGNAGPLPLHPSSGSRTRQRKMIGQMTAPRPRSDRSAALAATVFGIAALAWIGIITFHAGLPLLPQSGHAASHLAEGQAGTGFTSWMSGWALMVVAMMLPPALPLVRAMEKLTSGRSDRRVLIVWVIVAFLAVWVVAGVFLYGAGTGLHAGLARLPSWAHHAGLFAGVAAIGAGLFQFTPLKKACLEACRSPTSVIMVRWQAATPRKSATAIGLAYGAICVGCCWAVMLLTVLVGALMLPVMVVAAALMMLERLMPSVRPLIPLQAGLAIVLGVLLIVGLLPPGFP